MVQPAVKVLNVTINEQGVDPQTLYAPGNEPIRFVVQNRTGRPYEFAIPAADYRIADVPPGQTRDATFTFVNVGTFDVVCRPTGGSGPTLQGHLVVQVLY